MIVHEAADAAAAGRCDLERVVHQIRQFSMRRILAELFEKGELAVERTKDVHESVEGGDVCDCRELIILV